MGRRGQRDLRNRLDGHLLQQPIELRVYLIHSALDTFYPLGQDANISVQIGDLFPRCPVAVTESDHCRHAANKGDDADHYSPDQICKCWGSPFS